MNSKNLAPRPKRIEDTLLPVLEEPIVSRIILVSPDGTRIDSRVAGRPTDRDLAMKPV